VYYREDAPVAVLGMNQPKLFTKWRRSLGSPAKQAVSAQREALVQRELLAVVEPHALVGATVAS
jgi:hypothetical protein